MTENTTQAAEAFSHLTAELDTISDGFDAEGFNVNALLLPALRQYQHNDCSGLLAGYDYAETQTIVFNLLKDLKKVLELADSCLEVAKDIGV